MPQSPLTFIFSFLLVCLASLTGLAQAGTVTYDWQVGWVRANPDGMLERPVIGINGQWPLPTLNITKGDRVIVNVDNQLGNQSTTIHFHGLYQNGTNSMDGPVGVTQCEIPPGGKFTYNFTIDQPGTYWYHSHIRAQYPDGIRGQLLVHDPENPYKDQYDVEVPLSLSDWYHDEMPVLLKSFISYKNPTGAEPVPKSSLINDTQNLTIPFTPGSTYFFRISNIGAFAGQYFWIEGHTMRIVEVDGVYTEPAEASMIYLTAAQRCSVLVTARNDSSANFPIVTSMDTTLFDTIPDDLNYNSTAWLVYDSNAPNPAPATVDELDPFDDYTLVPYDKQPLLDKVDYSFNLDLKMDNLGDGANYAFFNDISYVTPKVPTLYTALSTNASASNAAVYGTDTNAFVLEKDEVVEIILNNDDSGRHPFHLHGHAFQAVLRADENSGFYDANNHSALPATPMRRDTFMVNPESNIVLRFRADNPGIWLFHCHIEWHIATGLVATMVEAPLELQKTLSIPDNHYQACRDSQTPYQGNAAGNTEDFLDLTGENKSVPPLPAGFTARGIVALVFSCVSAFAGMGFIAWYGAAPLSSTS